MIKGVMTTNGDFWGLKIMATRGKVVDVIHHLSPKVLIIFLDYHASDVEISLKYGARLSPNEQQSHFL